MIPVFSYILFTFSLIRNVFNDVLNIIAFLVLYSCVAYIQTGLPLSVRQESSNARGGYSLPFYMGGPFQYLGSEILQQNHIWGLRITA